MRRFIRSAMLVALAITTGLVASSNASAAMVKSVVETVSNVQNIFTIMAAAPAQPAAPTAVAGNKSATVTWTAPANNGAAITSYTVTSNPGDLTCTVNALTCVVSGLSNETAYTFTVKATNSLGTSVASAVSNSVTPTHTPKILRSVSMPTSPTPNIVFSSDGRYAFWATTSSPPEIVKYDISAKTVLEKITLGSTNPAISSVVSHGSNAYFFFSKGYVQVDLEQFYVVATRSGNIEGWLYPSIDPTGTYLFGIKNSNSVNYGTYVHKYEASTGNLVSSYYRAFNEYTFFGSVSVGTLLYVLQENGDALYLQKVNESTMLGSGSAIKLQTPVALCFSCASKLELSRDSENLLMRIGERLVRFNLANASIDFDLNLAGTPDVVAASFGSTTPTYYWANSNSSARDGLLRTGSHGNGTAVMAMTYAPKTPLTTSPITKPVAMQVDGSVLRLFVTVGTSASYMEFATTDVASQPLNPTARYGDTKATLSWSAPSDVGASSDLRYRVESSDGQFGCETSEVTCEITGLTNGVSYTFTVIPITSQGQGVSSAAVSVVPKRVADPPTNVTAVYGAASATVSWTAPVENGGALITSYRVTSSPEGKTCSTSVTRSCSVTGLTNGVEYTFTVQASNVVGLSASSVASTAVIPRSVPSAPSTISGTFGNAKVTVQWAEPASTGGATITGYRVVASPGSQSCTTDALTFTCDVTGLTNGTSYTFAVTAQNSEGFSAVATSAAITPATVPNAPGAPTISSVGNQTVSLAWTAPTSTGGAAISSYLVTSAPQGKTCTTTSSTRSCTISGLTNGTSYSFSVVARNIAGSSPASLASSSAVPRTNPSAPTSVTASWGNASAAVTWTAPSTDGGFAISSYRATAVQDSTKFCIATAPTTTCTISGLTNGTAYTFRVTATNAAALASAASTASNEVVPKTTPSAPLAPSIVAGDGQLTLTWTAQGDGGSPILSYRVVEAEDPTITCTVIAPSRTCTFADLANGATYSFTVVATNVLGDSPPSSVNTATPFGLPDAPVIYETQPINNSVIVRWSGPAFDGGSPVLEYTVTANPSGKTCTTILTECEVTGLTNGVAYSFTVKAKNLRGFSLASDSVASEPSWGTPSAPSSVLATPGEWETTVSWQAPSNTNQMATTYTVVSDPPGFGCTVTELTSCVVSELINGTSYRFNVTATNEINLQTSVASAWSNSVVPAEAPSEPQNVRVRNHSLGLLVSWSAPAFDGGAAVTSYLVRDEEWQFECVTLKTFCIIEGLDLGANYSFTVRAENSVAQSMPSEPTAGVSYQIAQLENLDVTASVVEGEISANWSKPQALASAAEVTYLAVAEPSSKFCEVVEPARTCRISGLEQGITYTVSILATDQLGNSIYSSLNPTVLVYSKPSTPQAPSVTAGDGSVRVTWVSPSDGGMPILSYRVVESSNPNLNCVVVAPAVSCNVLGLANGTTYSFKVSATNIAGDSQLSNASINVVPIGTPAAPTQIEVFSGNSQIRVSWSSPQESGGSPITGYTVTSNPGAKTCTTAALECTVTGLTNGTKYTFTVKARNTMGLGAASEISRAVAPWSVPSAPTGIKATPGEGSAEVSWIAPTNTDSESTTYSVTSTPGGFECTVVGQTSCVIEGLENGVAYTFTVIAVNEAGASKASAASAAMTPRTVPDAPQQVVPRVVSTGIEVSWIAPEFDGGAKVSFYTATAEPAGKTCVTNKTTCVITGLTQGEDYYVSVTASNAAGESVAKEYDELVTFGAVPGKPNSVFAIAGPGEMTVSWAAPANTGGSLIEYYVAESTPGGFLCVVEGQSCVITGLTNGTKYTFTVRAANEFGESDNSIASAALAPVAKPGQPSVVESVFISYDELLVTWTSASASVSAYQVSLLEPNYPYAEIDSITVSSSTFSHIFEGLNPGDAYRVQVIAYGGGANYIRAASAPARKVGPVLFTEYPTVSGSAMVGKTISATDGVYAGLPAPTLTRAWFRCNVAQAEMSPLTKDCVAIKGATGGSYKLTASDLGKFIAFGVTATNAYGDTVAYGIVPGKVVSAPILSRPSTFSGTAKSGKTLTSSLGSWVGTAKITYKYQWMRCTATYKAASSKGAKCSAIAGATKTTYKLATADVGKYVRLLVTATNAYGKFEWHTATSGKVTR